MIEIPVLNRQILANPLRDPETAKYCDIIRLLFFPAGVHDRTPQFRETLPIAFLLFTDAHPELMAFMSRPEARDLLDDLSRDPLHVFCWQPEEGKTCLTEREKAAMETLHRIFDLGDKPVHPHIVLCDLEMNHRGGRALGEHIYDARLQEYFPFEIENLRSQEYKEAFRDSLGRAIAVVKDPNVESPARTLANALSEPKTFSVLRPSIGRHFREDLTAEFVAAWAVLM